MCRLIIVFLIIFEYFQKSNTHRQKERIGSGNHQKHRYKEHIDRFQDALNGHGNIIPCNDAPNASHCRNPFYLRFSLPHAVAVQQRNRIGKADLQEIIEQHQHIDEAKQLNRLQTAPARDIKRNTF